MLTSIDFAVIGIIHGHANLFLLLLSVWATLYKTTLFDRERDIFEFSSNKMIYWTLFALLLLPSLRCEVRSLTEDIIPYVHLANNDQWLVLAHNREEVFHFTRSPYQSPTVIFDLSYTSLETDIVQSLSIPEQAFNFELIEFVFIGGLRNSAERSLFHAKLRKDEAKQSLLIVHLNRTSITSLSSVGFESVVGIHPLGMYAVVVGDRGGYIYDMNTSSGHGWSAWDDSTDEHYPRVVSVSRDGNVFVGANTLVKGAIVPTLYFAKVDPDGIQAQRLTSVEDKRNVEVKSIRAPMSMALRGVYNGDDFAWLVGFPSLDLVVLLYTTKGPDIFVKTHRSVEKGINFGQSVVLTENKTYGVLSSALPTAPWSTGRVEVCDVFFAVRREEISQILACVSFNE